MPRNAVEYGGGRVLSGAGCGRGLEHKSTSASASRARGHLAEQTVEGEEGGAPGETTAA